MSGTNEMHPGLSGIQKAIYDYVPERIQQWMNDRQTVQSVEATFREWDQERRIEQNAPVLTEEAKATQSWNTDLGQSYMAEMAERDYQAEMEAGRDALEYRDTQHDYAEAYADVAGDATLSWRLENESPIDILNNVRREALGYDTSDAPLRDPDLGTPGNVASITEHPNYPTISQEQRDAWRAASIETANPDQGVLQFRQIERDRIQDGGLEK